MSNWLNYHHLLYFWTVAREGSVTRASQVLLLAEPTISGQIKAMESHLGITLFHRSGKRLVLSETGRLVFEYADQIFTLGRELQNTLQGQPGNRPNRFVVGIANVLPKLIVHELLQPALALCQPMRLVCLEDSHEQLLAELAIHKLDLVLSDVPINPGMKVKAFSHLLGECNVELFATKELAKKLRVDFPQSLHNAPLLLPTPSSQLRHTLDSYFNRNDIRPTVVGEFDDSALLKTFGQSGLGAFFAPSAIAKQVCQIFQVTAVGTVPLARERFFAISVERHLRHPAVVAISEGAKSTLFSDRDTASRETVNTPPKKRPSPDR